VLERGRYPRGIVHVDLPPEFLDVNVHPQKAEVRFADPRALADALYGMLSRALASAFSLPTPNRSAWGKSRVEPAVVPLATALPMAQRAATGERSAASASRDTTSTSAGQGDATRAPSGATPLQNTSNTPLESLFLADPAILAVRDSAASQNRPQSEIAWASLRFVAQLRQTYLLCESAEGIYLLDQHAAAERVTFTRLRKQYQGRAVPSQALLFPVTLDVLPAEAELVELRGKEMAEVGLDVRVRGPESISVHAVPKLLQRASAERLLRDLLSEVSRKGGRGFSDAVDLALATMACHGSIRAGDPLAPDEVKALLEALDDADFAGHCPHGRPVVTFLSWAELERKVGRR
jgi:DNA mismatch repair protein MutL